FAREIPVAAHFESPIALRNHLTAPCRLHGRPPSIWAELNSVVALREKLQDARTAERPYLPPPPKKPLASRRICERMNGSGSAPITIDPGWPHGVQQTTLPGGVFRYTPRVPYEDCCRYFCRASAGEATSIPRPRTEAINPTEADAVVILARGMDSSIGSRPTLRQICRPSPTQASQRSSHLRVGGCSSSSLRADAIVRRYWVTRDMSRTRLRARG